MNPNQTGARRAAEPATTTPKLAPIINHPLFIGLALLTAAVLVAHLATISATLIANWIIR